MGRTSANPFTDDVFVDHADNLPGVEQIHGDTVSKLVDAVETMADTQTAASPFTSAGRTILLTAPRAGYGKSHLVARMRELVSETASSFVLPFQPAKPISWSAALDSVLLQATRGGGDDPLTEIGRNFLTIMVRSALESGVVEHDHFPADSNRLERGDLKLFSQQSPDNVVDWTNERCELLARSLGDSNTSPTDSRGADAHFWARLFIDRELGDRRAFERAIGLSDSEARRRCLQFLRISASLRPVVIILDGLDAFFSSETAGLEIATVVAAIRDEVPRSLSVICLNEEIWNSVFGDKLPSAFFDRLTGEKSKLDPITAEAATELVIHRLARIEVSGHAAKKFSSRLAESNRWNDAGTNLTPRVVLRQARDLWEKSGDEILKSDAPTPEPDLDDDVSDVPLSELSDKADFFADLQENGLPGSKEIKSSPPVPEADDEPAEEEPIPENPFFAAPSIPEPEPNFEQDKLDGIESIIRDIRGSGSSVISETHKGGGTGTRPIPTIKAGPIKVTPTRNGSAAKSGKSTAQSTGEEKSSKITKRSIGQQIEENHRELLTAPSLSLDLARLGKFLKAVGQNHPGLSQTEEHLPGAQIECLRWMIHGQSVLLGFESPKNVYFWNHLLQQSLASNKREKISAFSHSTQVFDSDLFATFGFSPAVIRGRIDPIEMSDEELALLYAADSVLESYRASGDEAMAMQFITQQLDPLWRRIGQTV